MIVSIPAEKLEEHLSLCIQLCRCLEDSYRKKLEASAEELAIELARSRWREKLRDIDHSAPSTKLKEAKGL